MSKFKVGDKVKQVSGSCGSIEGIQSRIAYLLITEVVESPSSSYYYHYDAIDINDKKFGHCHRCLGDRELELLDTSKIITGENNHKNIMTTIKDFVKNLTLSADEKAMREVGLKSAEGEYTKEAIDIIVADLCVERESRLIEIANKMVAEKKATE